MTFSHSFCMVKAPSKVRVSVWSAIFNRITTKDLLKAHRPHVDSINSSFILFKKNKFFIY